MQIHVFYLLVFHIIQNAAAVNKNRVRLFSFCRNKEGKWQLDASDHMFLNN